MATDSSASQVGMRLWSRHTDHSGAADGGRVIAGRHLQTEVLQEVRRVGQVGGIHRHYGRVRFPIKLGGG